MIGGVKKKELVFCAHPGDCPLQESCLRNKDSWTHLPPSMVYSSFVFKKDRCKHYLPVDKIVLTPELAYMLHGTEQEA